MSAVLSSTAELKHNTAPGTSARSTRPTSSRACWPASCSRAWRPRPSTGTPLALTATSMACALSALLCINMLWVPERTLAEATKMQHWVVLKCGVAGLPLRPEARPAACRPIDFVAAGITGVLSHHRSGFDAYHVVNPHWDDGVSLDAIIGWVAESRGGLRTVQDYSQWCVPPPALPLLPTWHGTKLVCVPV